MTAGDIFLHILKDEAETLLKYSDMLEGTEVDDAQCAAICEIIADELNHAFTALIEASKAMGFSPAEVQEDEVEAEPDEVKDEQDLPTEV